MAISGQVTCHCGQDIAGYTAGPGKHVRPSGGVCVGIDERLHTPAVCWECRNGTHAPGFTRTLDVIRWETYGPEGYAARGFRPVAVTE